jgi:uncharacterized repeat protein (TIGR01451 family)
MIVRRALLVLCLAFLPVAGFAVVGTDVAVTATDSPDPVAPDGNITYTVTVTNTGTTATNAHMNLINGGTMLFQSMTVPAGWSCGVIPIGSGASFTCTAATLASGSSDVFTIVMNAGVAQQGVLDHTISQLFTVNATESDPNNGNNSVTVTTAYVAPHVDMTITATDSPDPVNPDGNITYTINVFNNGPDPTTNAHFNAVLNGTLLFQSMTAPAGWSCGVIPVGSGASFTCTAATLAASTNSPFTVVLKAGVAQFGVTNQTINQLFGVNSAWFDPNNANNNVTVSTSYVAPHVDMQITATDSPDPVAPDGNITYAVTVTNAGPDAAQNAHFNVVLNNTLRYQSLTVPAGWSCPGLVVGQGTSITCTAATLAPSTVSNFTLVLNAGLAQFGVLSQTINEVLGVNSDWFDPNNANNTVTVSTLYATPSVDLGVTASDAPDPVSPDGNITYTVTVTNAGPDGGTNAHLNVPLNNTLLFQSLSAPAGWTCAAPPVNGGTSFTCTAATLAASSTSVFTIVLKAGLAQFGNSNQTIVQNFNVNSGAADPVNTNNSVNVSTAYVVPTANLAVTNSDAPDPVNTGGTITYTQTLTNNGPDAAANAKIVESIGSGVTFQSVSASAGFSCTTPAVGGTGTITCSIASMANGATASFTVIVNVTAVSGSIMNTVVGSSDAFDPVTTNNSATAITTINVPLSADLVITKTTPTTSAAPGNPISYTITVTNNGPSTASSVTMTDLLPTSLLFQSIAAPGGFSCTAPAVGATGTISCTGASLANGASAIFTLGVTVAPGATGSIVNSASVLSATSDPNPGNSSVGAGAVATAPASPSNVPALSTWALMLLAAILGVGALMRIR